METQPYRAWRIVALVVGVGVVLAAARGLERVQVQGASMLPALCGGDRLLAVRWPVRAPLWLGWLVTVPDPRASERVLVKRVAGVGPGWVSVAGDNAAASTDSRVLGRLPRRSVRAVAVYRYHPATRTGWLWACRRQAGPSSAAASAWAPPMNCSTSS